jgi:GDP-L-fucose synthase
MAVKRSVLLTGGGGMVGRNVLEHPRASAWEFVAPRSTELDLTDYAATERFVKAVNPEFVIHSAGLVGGIQANIAHPVDFLVTNLDVGRNIVMASRAAGVKKLLNLGSSCMYPRDAPNPLRESFVLKGELEPTNEGYALAKIAIQRLCSYVSRVDPAFHYKTMIPCNIYGRHDKFSPEHSHLIPAIIHKIHLAKINALPDVEIWGDGTARREFMYSGDLADAILKALDDWERLPAMMNAGLGYDYSVSDYYTAAADVIGWRGSFRYDSSKPVGMRQKLEDISLQTIWGWFPSTSLLDGIRQTYMYYLENTNL